MDLLSFLLRLHRALGDVVGPQFSGDQVEVLFAPVGLFRGPKWGPAVPIFFKLNRKFGSCIYIFNYACPIFKFKFNILKNYLINTGTKEKKKWMVWKYNHFDWNNIIFINKTIQDVKIDGLQAVIIILLLKYSKKLMVG